MLSTNRLKSPRFSLLQFFLFLSVGSLAFPPSHYNFRFSSVVYFSKPVFRIFAGCRLCTSRRAKKASRASRRCSYDGLQPKRLLRTCQLSEAPANLSTPQLEGLIASNPPSDHTLNHAHLPDVTVLPRKSGGARGSCGYHHKWVILPHGHTAQVGPSRAGTRGAASFCPAHHERLFFPRGGEARMAAARRKDEKK